MSRYENTNSLKIVIKQIWTAWKHACLFNSFIYMSKPTWVPAGELHILLVASWEGNLSDFMET